MTVTFCDVAVAWAQVAAFAPKNEEKALRGALGAVKDVDAATRVRADQRTIFVAPVFGR